MAKSLHQQFGADAPQVLSGALLDQAERIPIPQCFVMKVGSAPNNVNIVDTYTGKVLNVGLCDLPGVRLALQAFITD